MSSQMHLLEESDKQEGAILFHHLLFFPFCLRILELSLHPFPFLRELSNLSGKCIFTWNTGKGATHWRRLKMLFLVGTEKLILIHIFSSRYFILKFWVSRKFHSAGGGIIQREIPLWFLYQQAPWNWFGLSSCFT